MGSLFSYLKERLENNKCNEKNNKIILSKRSTTKIHIIGNPSNFIYIYVHVYTARRYAEPR